MITTDAIRALAAGDWRNDTLTVDGPDAQKARLKRHRRDVWSLDTVPPITRNRWGNLTQITEDVRHFETYGRLPPPEGDRW